MLYLSAHDDEQSVEIFLRVKAKDCSWELIALYDMSWPAEVFPASYSLLKQPAAAMEGNSLSGIESHKRRGAEPLHIVVQYGKLCYI